MSDYRTRLENLKAEKGLVKKYLKNKKEELRECKKEKKSAEEARTVLQIAAKNTQKNLEKHFSSLVSTAFQIIFEDPYEFRPIFTEKRNKTVCELWFEKNGKKLRPEFSSGGAVMDVASFALRQAYWKLENRFEGTAPVMIFDEPFQNVESRRKEHLAEIIRFLSQEFGLQIIVVTHDSEIAESADRKFEVNEGLV